MLEVYISRSVVLIENYGLFKSFTKYKECRLCEFDKLKCGHIAEPSGIVLCRRLSDMECKSFSDDVLRITRLSAHKGNLKSTGLNKLTSLYSVKYFNYGRFYSH